MKYFLICQCGRSQKKNLWRQRDSLGILKKIISGCASVVRLFRDSRTDENV